ncbi:MAG: bacillithiol biosynthesis deacetylase BshB1 [Ignavibacteriales bacterium]|nr:bacillithiol biosynthesis deacetylase BshB1 [Ignavibacteriales bacterium]
MTVDVLAIGAHPDDIELTAGGAVAKLVKQGYKVALAELTQGELGTRGTKEIRATESEEARKILGAVARRNLLIPDGNIEINQPNLHKVIALIREFQPKILLIPPSVERHPDHVHTYQLCKEAWFYAGLEKIKTSLNGTPQTPHRPHHYFEYMQWHEFQPSFIVDISDTMDIKMAAIRAHVSQFYNPHSKDSETKLSDPGFLNRIENGAMFYGKLIGVKYGEPFYSWSPFGVGNLFDLVLAKG